jgi:hypothetical protein
MAPSAGKMTEPLPPLRPVMNRQPGAFAPRHRALQEPPRQFTHFRRDRNIRKEVRHTRWVATVTRVHETLVVPSEEIPVFREMNGHPTSPDPMSGLNRTKGTLLSVAHHSKVANGSDMHMRCACFTSDDNAQHYAASMSDPRELAADEVIQFVGAVLDYVAGLDRLRGLDDLLSPSGIPTWWGLGSAVPSRFVDDLAKLDALLATTAAGVYETFAEDESLPGGALRPSEVSKAMPGWAAREQSADVRHLMTSDGIDFPGYTAARMEWAAQLLVAATVEALAKRMPRETAIAIVREEIADLSEMDE